MDIKNTLENHPAVLLFLVLVAGFAAGIGTVSYLEAREDKLREDIIDRLRSENTSLSQRNEALNEENKTALAMAELANAEYEELLSQNESLNSEKQELLAMAESVNTQIQSLSAESATQEFLEQEIAALDAERQFLLAEVESASADIELVGKAMSSLLTAYVWIERDVSPDKVIPELDNAINKLNTSKAVTSITSLTSARATYQRAPKGEVQRKLDDAISQIEAQISK